ncbi:MAG: gamma-glutamyl-phosphate reductase, partial [Actinomycetes bacterium]
MTEATGQATQAAIAAKAASRELASATSEQRVAAIRAIADALIARSDEILAANALDLQAGEAAGLEPA